MYPITDNVRLLFQDGCRQVADISYPSGGGTAHITTDKIVSGGLTIDRYSVTGNRIEIGSASASELILKLFNIDGSFNDVNFEGVELFVRAGVVSNGSTYYVPLGYFTVDEPPRKLSVITLHALDRMVKFDKDVDEARLTFPTTAQQLLNSCCTICGVQLSSVSNSLPNGSFIIPACPDTDGLTYRQLIIWIAQITGTCAFIDWDGQLRLQWYSDTTTSITAAERFTSDVYEDNVVITGVQVEDADGTAYLAGTDIYAFLISGNGLVQQNYAALATSLNTILNGFAYLPYTCTVKPIPHVYPLDKISFTDKSGTAHSTIITNVTFKLNGATSIAAKGKTLTSNSYADGKQITNQESTVINKLKKQTNDKFSAADHLNAVISNSLGLYRSEVEQQDGSSVWYYHDETNLAESHIIYTFRSGGFAWTDSWNGGSPTWHYGITRDGNAVVNILNAYKITADLLEAGCVTADKIDINGFLTAYGADIGTIAARQIIVNGASVPKGKFIVSATLPKNSSVTSGTVFVPTTNITDTVVEVLSAGTPSERDDNTAIVTDAGTPARTGYTVVSAGSPSDRAGQFTLGRRYLFDGSSYADIGAVTLSNIYPTGAIAGELWYATQDLTHYDVTYTAGTLYYWTGAIWYAVADIYGSNPKKTSDLNNDAGYTDATGVVSIIDGRVTADYVEALSILVAAANITGQLTAGQINANGITATDVHITGELNATAGAVGSLDVEKDAEVDPDAITVDAGLHDADGYYTQFTYNGTVTKFYFGHTQPATEYYSFAVNRSESVSPTGKWYSEQSLSALDSSVDRKLWCKVEAYDANSSLIVNPAEKKFIGSVPELSSQYFVSYANNLIISKNRLTFRDDTGSAELSSGIFWNERTSGGTPLYAATLRGTWKSESPIEVASARVRKQNIEPLDNRHTALFDRLNPRQYEYKDGHGRKHYGFVLDELKDAIDGSGLSATDCAAYCLNDTDNPNGDGGIRYEEIVPLLVREVQNLKNQLKSISQKGEQ